MKKLKTFSLPFLLGATLVACSENSSIDEVDEGGKGEIEAASEYENGHLLADPAWVDENQDDLVIIDVRREGYEQGHIPGAVHLTPEDIQEEKDGVSGIIQGEEEFEQVIRSAGVDDDSSVVVYDGDNSLWASRLFYGFELYGHEDVRVLNGGYAAWLADDKDISTDAPSIEEGTFTAQLNEELQASQEDVETFIQDESCLILDTRSEEEFEGETARADRGGHIPGASHLEWSEAVEDDGIATFKSAEELEEQFGTAGVDRDQTIVPYCQTNVRGAHTYFSLRLLGFENIIPYEGSWAEWGNDPDVDIQER
ncbi:sulfurtransferase [Texcoconibacillus texcoconensis]|uniref:thiosulfate sulfurtransferase n=1 Tax=Texcoconibacillus texcoconensis TaxID=1095777 RepID=A0A840QKN5_9BACI|nr:sulfurtransferase [Texcoconibacillus texcoconensis]MBB5171883.1 thiosulfate/3-mercaptopyruvate sulfurtransferase [Texcoconibacillus texcoconensis]